MATNDEQLLDYVSDNEENEKNQNGKYTSNYENAQPGYTTIHATSFKEFLLKQEIQRAISEAGFEHPSAVQQECIQNAIMGNDLLCQAKSGMGKTAVFVLTILQGLNKDSKTCSSLILCHTRELAYQIHQEFKRLGKFLPEIRAKVFYGGESIDDQRKILSNPKECPHIIVGTPGRTLDLVNKKYLDLKDLKFFVLDECDKMLEQIDMRKDVQQIFQQTPYDKQVMMYSATMSQDIRKICRKFMQKQIEVSIDNDEKLTLDGLQQYYLGIKEEEKNKKLFDLLDALIFNQVIIFVKSVQRAIHLDKLLQENNFPSIAIHSGLKQEERISKYKDFKEFKKRIMVSTDIFGRGIDVSRVNIVINYDMPIDNNNGGQSSTQNNFDQLTDTYLHRVGRAGRFGTKGLAISFVSSTDDEKVLQKIQNRFVVSIKELPDEIDTNQYMNN